MRTAVRKLFIVVLAVAPIACKRPADKAALPPAQGPGAAPLPALPKIETAPAAAPESTTVAPTEGRTTGTTFPRAEAQIGPNGPGVITRILVKEGDRIRKGTVLFRQDTADGALRVEQAKAALAAAKVNFSATQTEWTRTKTLFEQKAVSQMQWDQIQARMDGARVGIQQAEVALQMAEKALADATVRSPLDGVVVAKLKSEGEMATMMPPTVVLVLQDQSVLELRFRLPERDLARVKVGDAIAAKLDALGVTRPAKIIRVQPSIDPRTRTVEFVAALPNADGALKPGLLAEVDLSAPAPPEQAAVRPAKAKERVR